MIEFRCPDVKALLTQSLREKPGSYLIEEIFNRFPTLNELLDASEQELVQIKGVGSVKAKQITAMLQFGLSLSAPPVDRKKIISPQDVYALLEPEFRQLKKEHFVCFFLDTKNQVLGKEVISVGSLNATIVHPREVFRAAIKRCSASIICAHNHPTGDAEPSPEDIEITKRLASVANIVGIELLDHIIIGHYQYVSLKERGLMK